MSKNKDGAIATTSLDQTEKKSAEVAKTKKRVTLQSIKDKLKDTEFFNPKIAPHMTVVIVTMQNGFVLTGTSTPADPENFDEKLGQELAFEDALRQAWPLEAYALLESE